MSGTNATGWSTGDVPTAAEYQAGCWRIYDTTLGVAAANVDITPIVASYAHLLVNVYGRSDTAATTTGLFLRFNNDSTANYDYQYVRGSAATASAVESLAATVIQIGTIPANTAGANLFGACDVNVPHYAGSTNNKSCIARSLCKFGTASGNLFSETVGGSWRSSAAITRVTILPGGGNLAAGTRVTIYAMGA